MSSSRRRRAISLVAATASLGLALAAVSGATLAPASANAGTPGLKISEVYGGGGNSGATLKNDFIELKNTGATTASLGGLSLQYRSAAGTGAPNAGNVFALPSADVPPGQTYLVQAAAGTGGTADLPTPDATSSLAISGSGGQVYLAGSADPVDPGTGNVTSDQVVDFVGWGSSTTSFETARAGATSNTTSVQRVAGDTNDNSADFSVAAPTPSNCGTACGSTPPPPPPPPTDATIAQIQGTDTGTSPFQGGRVTTAGVVTAAYPAGGFYGYVLQTPGTGGGNDATPGASDAIYVYQPSGAVTAQIGQYLQVTGSISEFGGTAAEPQTLTELTVAAADATDLGTPPAGVTPLSTAYPTTDAGREAHESELLAPTDRFTVTDNYSTNKYAEIGLATGDHQLIQPTDVANPHTDPARVAAVTAENAARGVVLDDGASTNFLPFSDHGAKDTPLPWLSTDNPVRIGSEATLHAPVILDYRNATWKFQPTSQVTGSGASVATFGDTRTPNLAPQPVGGNVKLGTFNVLNYFNTTGKDWIAEGNTCSFYTDRNGDPVTDNSCSGNGPRGAAESSGGTDLADPTADVERQRVKEVRAINTMDADIVSLEEIENSVALGEADRDDALKSLVNALNADPGKPHPWAYAPSPDPSDLPPTADQDVIRTAFIYNPDKVALVGASKVLSDQSGPGQPFENAREPLAQEFKRTGAMDSDGFAVIVNHFKSKGSGVDDGSGQGNANPDRVAQAHALVDFANAVKQSSGTNRVFLVGDFNSYTQEDPMQVLYAGGYVNQASDDPRDVTYEFGGMAGSLDHVLANTSAANLVTGRDVWQIDAEESVGFEYSRYNYNATQLYQPNQFRASDHNPEIVGLDAPFTQADSSVSVTASPAVVQKKKGRSTVTATVTSSGSATPTGTVDFYVNGAKVGSSTLSAAGVATMRVGPFANRGTVNVEVRYLGDTATNPGSATTTITVTNGKP
ncbi:MAG: ExeM/NucH family extracellular endonuclease [Nocardioides sp.]